MGASQSITQAPQCIKALLGALLRFSSLILPCSRREGILGATTFFGHFWTSGPALCECVQPGVACGFLKFLIVSQVSYCVCLGHAGSLAGGWQQGPSLQKRVQQSGVKQSFSSALPLNPFKMFKSTVTALTLFLAFVRLAGLVQHHADICSCKSQRGGCNESRELRMRSFEIF